MELGPEDIKRLEKVALTAMALVVGGAVVKYVWKQDKIEGYVYNLKSSGGVLVGLVGDIGEKPIQFGGEIIRRGSEILSFKPEDPSISADQIPEFERVFLDASEISNSAGE